MILTSERVAAQSPGGVHPTTADPWFTPFPPMPAGPLQLPDPSSGTLKPNWPEHPADSPLMNLGLGGALWNHGEAAVAGAPNTGGFLDWQLHAAVLDNFVSPFVTNANVFPYEPTAGAPEGWQAVNTNFGSRTGASRRFWKFRGYLRDHRHSGSVDDAGFEVIAPLVRDTTKPTVIVLQTPSTMGYPAPNEGIGSDIGTHAYVGWNARSGLQHQSAGFTAESFPPQPLPPIQALPLTGPAVDQWSADIQLMQRNEDRRQGLVSGATFAHNVISVRVMPRLSLRAARFQMQRNLEVVRAVQQMFTNGSADPAWRPPAQDGATQTNWTVLSPIPLRSTIPCLIQGGSLGGGMAMWAALFFPEDFDGAAGFGATFTARPWVGEQGCAQMLSALSGFSMRALDLNQNEILHYSAMLYGIAQARGFGANFRPFFHGSAIRGWRENYLTRPVLVQSSDEDFVTQGNENVPWISGQRAWVGAGYTQPNSAGGQLYWSLVAKNCHTKQKPFEFTNGGPVQILTNQEDATLEFLPVIVNSASQVRTVIAPTSTENASEDPYEQFLQPLQPAAGRTVPAPPAAAPLHLDPTFINAAIAVDAQRPGKSFGNGTRLGAEDSMLVTQSGPWAGEPETEVFVGSAEGVVSKLAVDPGTNEVVTRAMSPALGSGAWAMAVSEADGAPGKELIVATHRGLHVLDRSTLVVINSRRDLPWDMTRPRHMRIADVIPGGYSEVILVSDLGRLAIFDATTLTEVASYGEPGIKDVQVVATATQEVSLALLSHRGHVVRLTWDAAAGSLGVTALSPRLNGLPVDMERCDALVGQPALAVLMDVTVPKHRESIWILDAVSLQPILNPGTGTHQITGSFSDSAPVSGFDLSHGVGADLEVVPDGFLLLRGPAILKVPFPTASGTAVALPLGSFPPLLRAVDLAVDPLGDRVFVSTEAGYVSCLAQAEISNGSLSFDSSVRQKGAPNAAPSFCNRTLSATWGMVADTSNPQNRTLEVIDQAGTRWSVKGNGDVTLVSEVGHVGGAGYTAAPGPFRSMRTLQGLAAVGPQNAPITVMSWAAMPMNPVPFLRPAQPLDVVTAPFVPGQFNALGTWEYDEAILLGESSVWKSGDLGTLSQLYVHDGLVVFQRCGDVLPIAGTSIRSVAWWGGEAALAWQNRAQGFRANSSNVVSWWSSTVHSGLAPSVGSPLGSQIQTQPSPSAAGAITGNDLRNQVSSAQDTTDAQSLRLFYDPVAGAERIALFNPGARLLILEPGASPSAIGGMLEVALGTPKVLDFGTGGLGLAVGATRHDPESGKDFVDLYLGSQAYFGEAPAPGATSAHPMVSALAHVEYECASSFAGARLRLKRTLVLDGPGGPGALPSVYGVCGMEVGELFGGTSAKELVVGALDGHLQVYTLNHGTGDFGAMPVFNEQVEGAVGLFNSIVIADLDANPGNELYVAGSLGLRRWVP